MPEPDAATAAMVVRAKAAWPEWERAQPLLVLRADGENWRGMVTKTGDGDKSVRYCHRLGLRLVEA